MPRPARCRRVLTPCALRQVDKELFWASIPPLEKDASDARKMLQNAVEMKEKMEGEV